MKMKIELNLDTDAFQHVEHGGTDEVQRALLVALEKLRGNWVGAVPGHPISTKVYDCDHKPVGFIEIRNEPMPPVRCQHDIRKDLCAICNPL